MEYRYRTTYFLVVDGKVRYYADDLDDVSREIADLYGGTLCIDYYGYMGRDEILRQGYMELHDGLIRFIAGTYLVDDIRKKYYKDSEKKYISIEILDIGYLFDYARERSGKAVIRWLGENSDKYVFDYSKSRFKRYCLMIGVVYENSFNTLEEALRYFVGSDKRYLLEKYQIASGVKRIPVSGLKEDKGYYTLPYRVVRTDGQYIEVAVIDMDRLFSCLSKPIGRVLGKLLDKDRNKYTLDIMEF